jgi:hypothetical protein
MITKVMKSMMSGIKIINLPSIELLVPEFD